MTQETFTPNDAGLWITKEDAEHHTKYYATASSKEKGVHTPSPVEVYIAGAPVGLIDPGYLDKFTKESCWYEEIQKFKAENKL